MLRNDTVLSGSNGTWSGSPTSYRYGWLRCDSDGSNCGPIDGASGSRYAITGNDIGLRLRLLVTAANAAGTGAATSAPSPIVALPKNGKLVSGGLSSGKAAVFLKARGTIRARRTVAWFALIPTRRSLHVTYFDSRTGLSLRSVRVTRTRLAGHHLTVGGRAVTLGRHHVRLWFSIRVADRGRTKADRFSIRLSSGYHRAARLARGDISISVVRYASN